MVSGVKRNQMNRNKMNQIMDAVMYFTLGGMLLMVLVRACMIAKWS